MARLFFLLFILCLSAIPAAAAELVLVNGADGSIIHMDEQVLDPQQVEVNLAGDGITSQTEISLVNAETNEVITQVVSNNTAVFSDIPAGTWSISTPAGVSVASVTVTPMAAVVAGGGLFGLGAAGTTAVVGGAAAVTTGVALGVEDANDDNNSDPLSPFN